MNIGDKVRVCRVDKSWGSYVSELSNFVGKVGEVIGFLDSDIVTLRFEGAMRFAFPIDWLEPAIDNVQEKALEYEVLSSSDESIKVARITQQKYRGNQFNFGEPVFRSSKKDIKLLSVEKPGIAKATIFVRGSNKEKDDVLLIFLDLDRFNDFVEIVNEYNQHVVTFFEKNKASIKVGDQAKVVKISKNWKSYLLGLEAYQGRVGTVVEINSAAGEALLIFADECNWWFLLSDLELHQDEKTARALNIAKENMLKWLSRINARSAVIAAASTIEGFMRAKKAAMLEAASLPLNHDTCVHCLINIKPDDGSGLNCMHCAQCDYGKVHGICNDEDETSTWQNIRDKKIDLLDALRKY